MATPNVGILTTTGKALIDKVNSGQAKISFSKVVFSSMDNSQLSDTQIKALTAIAPQEVVVSSPQTTLDTNSGETRIRATGTNEKLADGVYVKTYGVFAKDDTGNEILYGVTVSPNPNYFPAYDGVTPQAVTYSYKTVIQETSNITMTNSNDVYVSQEDLTEAIAKIPQPDLSGYDKTDDVDKKLQSKQDKLGFTAANDSTVVHTADMRKPASDVAGIEEVNTLQTQVDNSAVGTNLLTGTSSDLIVDGSSDTSRGWKSATVYNNLIAGSVYTFSSEVSVLGTATSIDVRPYNPTTLGAIDDSYTTFPIVNGKISGLVKPIDGYTTLIIYAGNSGNTHGNKVTFHHMKLEKGSVATDWCPNPEDKVNVADMRKPASDVAGIEEVNAKQDKIGYTPADDSKVAHLSGANNFDTVPTVNNNPLLLASSLPSDLARTRQANTFSPLQTFSQGIKTLQTGSYDDANSLVNEGLYFNTNLSIKNGAGSITGGFIQVLSGGIWDRVRQFMYSDLDNSLVYTRVSSDNGSTWSNWVQIITSDQVPTDLARTSQQTNFTAGLQSGGVDVATAADLNNYYHANASDDAALAAAKSATVPGIFWFEEV